MRIALAFLFLTVALQAQQHPRDKEIHDADTRAWWHTTETLSSDAMEGRDTGSAAYQRAADYVAKRFAAAGLKPAGDAGSYLQSVPMHEVSVEPQGTSFTLLNRDGGEVPLRFLEEITVAPNASLASATTAALTFRGYCGKDAMEAVAGKIVVCFGTQRTGLPTGAERVANARAGKAAGLINVDDPYFSIEPPRWPWAYARTVSLGPALSRGEGDGLLLMRMSAAAFTSMLDATGKDVAAILASGGKKDPLGSFEIEKQMRVKLRLAQRAYSSPNVLAMLPGSDATLKNEYVVIAAHLDGYGYGTPVDGDKLYNGALDDAAYVALLIQFADDMKEQHRAMKRSVVLCAFTGEEKGLLGATYFVEHPTVPIAKMAADINLDQLRPLFPLHLLTALAINDSTLGNTARRVGAPMGITFQADPEPERGLLRRADHYPFLRAGVPAMGFIFGYEPGTDAEKRYREWYKVRYHRPQDDVTQPINFEAAAKFNTFFYRLTETLANDVARPSFLPGTSFAPKP